MKIATYNVNSIRSRMHIVLPWLKKNKPDYFCMQETKVGNADFPIQEFAELGYQAVFCGHKQYSGVAIVSRQKPSKVIYGLNSEPEDPERIVTAIYDKLAIINAYIPQGQEKKSPQFAYKLDWFDRLKKYLQKSFRPQEKVILCGDLNVAPESIDVHDPKRIIGHVCFNPEVWKAYGEVKSWGFVDVFRQHHPHEAGQYTFFDYRVRNAIGRNLGWRVDHILATEALAGISKSCTIDLPTRLTEKPSDHVLIYAEFKGE